MVTQQQNNMAVSFASLFNSASISSTLPDFTMETEQSPICYVCGDHAPIEKLLKLRCDCYYCDACLERRFKLAMTDEASYPPRCHQTVISLNQARMHLPKLLTMVYGRKTLEMSTKNKTYCQKISCNAFIAPHSIHNGQAFCQKCREVTCVNCKEAAHFGPCSEDAGLLIVQNLAKEHKWQQCPDCRRVVEKVDGCNHMSCRCGCDFCYGCGGLLDECRCLGDEEDEDVIVDYQYHYEYRYQYDQERREREQENARILLLRELQDEIM